MNYAEVWSMDVNDSCGPSLTDDDIGKVQARWGIRFPDALLEMLKVRNGGLLRGSHDLFMFPLAPDHVDLPGSQVIMSLDDYAVRGWTVDEADLRSIRDELGDPSLVFPLYSDGHTCVALNLNAGDGNAATVCYLDFECWEVKEISSAFDTWIMKLMEAEESPDAVLAAQIERGWTPTTARDAASFAGTTYDPLADSECPRATPEEVFAEWGRAADGLVSTFEQITDRQSAMVHFPRLQEQVESYAACFDAMLTKVSTMDEMLIGQLLLDNCYPHGRVSGALAQARVRGKAVYKIIRPAIGILDDLI